MLHLIQVTATETHKNELMYGILQAPLNTMSTTKTIFIGQKTKRVTFEYNPNSLADTRQCWNVTYFRVFAQCTAATWSLSLLAAPSTAELSRTKPVSAETSRDNCGNQERDKENALYGPLITCSKFLSCLLV